MTDWGAHHFDIAQWGLGMDNSGPVEIIPPADPNATTGLRYLYADGVEMIHDTSRGGATFIGSDGKIFVDRGKFQADPETLGQEPLGHRGPRQIIKAIRARNPAQLSDWRASTYDTLWRCA